MPSRIEHELTDILRCELIAAGVADADQYRIEYVMDDLVPAPTPAPVDPDAREAFLRRYANMLDLPRHLLA